MRLLSFFVFLILLFGEESGRMPTSGWRWDWKGIGEQGTCSYTAVCSRRQNWFCGYHVINYNDWSKRKMGMNGNEKTKMNFWQFLWTKWIFSFVWIHSDVLVEKSGMFDSSFWWFSPCAFIFLFLKKSPLFPNFCWNLISYFCIEWLECSFVLWFFFIKKNIFEKRKNLQWFSVVSVLRMGKCVIVFVLFITFYL